MNVAVIIPCHNEELTVAKVVKDSLRLPGAQVYVFDNLSTDATAREAMAAGAKVIPSPRKGKGFVIQQAFESIEADIYLMVDGDDTYSMEHAPSLIEAVQSGACDMAVGARLAHHSSGAFRKFHLFGNRFFSALVSRLFGYRVSDILSGYRAFSRRFVKSVFLQSGGFEVETELTLQAISRHFSILEIELPYRERPQGSHSKLKTFDDGVLILKSIARLIRDYRPLPFFSGISFLLFVAGLAAGWAPVRDYVEFAYVYTLPRAVLAAGLMVLSAVLLGVGLILDSQLRLFRQQTALLSSLRTQNQEKMPAEWRDHNAA